MPSRKRNKGRARKEKKASAGSKKNDDDQQQQSQQAPSQDLQQLFGNLALEEKSNCTHGFPPLPADDICHNFIISFEFALHNAMHAGRFSEPYNPIDAFDFVVKSLKERNLMMLFQIEECHEQLSNSLISLGTNYLLLDTAASRFACVVAMFVMKFKLGGFDWPNSQTSATLRDMWVQPEREATHFFVKRIKCSCLKRKYKQMKSVLKVGSCDNCHQYKERKELLFCTGCRVAHYCSEECQRADWPQHKGHCTKFKSKLQSDA